MISRFTLPKQKKTMSTSTEVWLVYNESRSIKANRRNLAGACCYFRNLLEGPFMESKKFTIGINLGTAFSFEALRCIVRYADEGLLYRDPNNCHLFIEAIQLAIAWGYDELVGYLEDHLIDRAIDKYEIDVLTRLARDNLPTLRRLDEACNQFAESMERRDFQTISRCLVNQHKPFCFYVDCPGEDQIDEDKGWDEICPSAEKRSRRLRKFEMRARK